MLRYTRIVAFILSVVMLLSIVGCKKDSTAPSASVPASAATGSSETVPVETEAPAVTESTTPEADLPAESSEPAAETTPAEEETPENAQTGTHEGFRLSDVQPIVIDGHYQYNPYLLSKEAIAAFEPEFLAFYKDFLTAYMNYETGCACPNVDYAMQIGMVVDYECPFYSNQDLEFSWASDYDYDAQRLNWTYQVDKDTLEERITLVADAMQDFLDLVSPDDDEADKIQTLYHAYCPLMTYDYDRADSREKISGCYALTEHTGICVTFSYAFAQILSQADMDATTGSGQTTDDEAHVWNCVSVDGEYYFFDTTFELNYQGGNAYVYYGMNMDERVNSGLIEDLLWVGRYQSDGYVIAENHLNVH